MIFKCRSNMLVQMFISWQRDKWAFSQLGIIIVVRWNFETKLYFIIPFKLDI